MERIFVDTSGIAAVINKKDSYHQQAKGLFYDLSKNKCILVITNYIRAETHALLLSKAGNKLALQLLEEKSWYIEWVKKQDEESAISLIKKHHDKTYSLTDAVSFVVMARLNINKAVSFDRHFKQYGWHIL